MRTLPILLAALLLPTIAAAQIHDPRKFSCVAVRGQFVPECNGSLCEGGSVTGDLQGRFTTRITHQYAAGTGWLYSGWTRIELAGGKGRIETLDEGTTPSQGDGGTDQASASQVLVLTEATSGAYQGQQGLLVLTGGHAVGKPAAYAGRVCRALGSR
jgi:hypothetical protein